MVFLPSGEAAVSTRQKIGIKEAGMGARVAEGKSEVHPGLSISLGGWRGGKRKMGVCSMKSPPSHPTPPADTAARWTIHQRANQTDLEQQRELLLLRTATKSDQAAASAATDWPDSSCSNGALISCRSITEILTRMISPTSSPPHPPPPAEI